MLLYKNSGFRSNNFGQEASDMNSLTCTMNSADISSVLESHANQFHSVVSFNELTDKVVSLDLSKSNIAFTPEIYSSTAVFCDYIDQKRKDSSATYLIGGYKENREMYRRSELFDKNLPNFENTNEEPRSLHLGTDIWGAINTKIYAPLGGMVHSFAFNNNHGDYGVTIILQHQLKTVNFYTLYGHLSLKDIAGLRIGQFISRGEDFAHFGPPEENGNWPAHLHFQLIVDMNNYEGDYPGVCKLSEAGKYLQNSPNPDLVLNMNRFLNRH